MLFLCVGNVVDQHDAHGTAVVGSGDCVKPLLSQRENYYHYYYMVQIAQIFQICYANKDQGKVNLKVTGHSNIEGYQYKTFILYIMSL